MQQVRVQRAKAPHVAGADGPEPSDVNQLRSRVDGFRREFRVIACFRTLLAQADFFKQFNLIARRANQRICVQSPLQKYFASPVGQIISTNSRHPVPRRGAYHDRHERWDGMRWTRQRFARDGIAGRASRLVSDHQASGREMLQRTAKSCGPDAPTLASSSRS